MDAIELLKKDHKTVNDLFKSYHDEKDTNHKQETANKIFLELNIHAQAEEEIFYPAVQNSKIKEEMKKLVTHAFEEHHVVKVLIAELQELEAGDEVFDAKLKVLQENVEHHVKEEESNLFPEVKKVLSQELEELGNKIESRKNELKEELAA